MITGIAVVSGDSLRRRRTSKAVHERHHDVQENQVRTFLAREIQRQFAIGCEDRGETLLP
jgi:hypothetical protein